MEEREVHNEGAQGALRRGVVVGGGIVDVPTEPQVEQKLRLLQDSISSLDASLQELRERLSSVMVFKGPPEEKQTKDNEELVPLAHIINDQCGRVASLNMFTIETIQSLQI